MSYCRFSSDNYNCDIYAFADCYGGYTIHVAKRRYVGDIPKIPAVTEGNEKEFIEQVKKHNEFMKTAEQKIIGLPLDGENYSCVNLPEFLEKILEIKEAGYNVPDYVIEDIKAEILEGRL